AVSFGPRRLATRHRHRERRALADGRAYADVELQQIGEPAHDRKPEAETFRASATAVDLVELFEDSIELIRRDADTGIRDLEIQLVAARGAPEPHFAALGIANGVGHEVAEQPAQQLGIRSAAFAAR